MKLLELRNEAPIYYFAYGMLTDPAIMRGYELLGVGQLRNFSLELAGFANVIPALRQEVLGCLWHINRSTLGGLDRMEGYPFFYDRKSLPVYLDNVKYEAYVYIMRPDARERLLGSKVKGEYLIRVRRGYLHAGIPLQQLEQAL